MIVRGVFIDPHFDLRNWWIGVYWYRDLTITRVEFCLIPTLPVHIAWFNTR